jgi:hypothetical protein
VVVDEGQGQKASGARKGQSQCLFKRHVDASCHNRVNGHAPVRKSRQY